MTIYAWRCKDCGETMDSTSRTHGPSCCGAAMVRDYRSVQLPGTAAFQPHFNHAVGQHVTSMRDFTDALKIKAEENSRRTGADHSYVPVLPGDMPTPTRDTDIFETRNRLVHDKKITDMQEVK